MAGVIFLLLMLLLLLIVVVYNQGKKIDKLNNYAKKVDGYSKEMIKNLHDVQNEHSRKITKMEKKK